MVAVSVDEAVEEVGLAAVAAEWEVEVVARQEADEADMELLDSTVLGKSCAPQFAFNKERKVFDLPGHNP